MRWTILRSCYTFPMRVFIGGQAVTVPARWYFCDPKALPFPFDHGCEASPWLLNFERNDDWGEVTPWPQDQRPGTTWRGLDRGKNPGYAGQCYVGDPQWFVDGQLPADILTRPPLPLPECCYPTQAIVQGGIVIGGTAVASGPPGARTGGGLVLGGTGTPTGPRGAVTAGGLVLGGTGRAGAGLRSAGGLVLGGTGVPGTGGGGPTCDQAVYLPLNIGTPPQSFQVGVQWWRLSLVAGQTYHVILSGPPNPPIAYWSIATGTCASPTIVDADGYICSAFVAPVSGTYYLQVTVQQPGPGSWSISVGTGPCP